MAYIGLVGDGSSSDIPVQHNLGSLFVGLFVYSNDAPRQRLWAPYTIVDENNIVINNQEVWAIDEYTAVVTLEAQSETTPPVPGTLQWVSSTSGSLTFTFSGASDADSGIAHIDAYDATTNTVIESNISSPWTRNGLLASTPYGTYLMVFDNAGNSAVTNTVTHSTDAPPADSTPPTPGTLTYAAKTDTQITYTFDPGADNIGVTHIDAYDADTNSLIQANVTSPWARGSGSGANGPLTGLTQYRTFLRYIDAAGNHADSNIDARTTNAPPPQITYVDSKAQKTASNLDVMPTHQQNDLLVMVAYRDGFNTPPSVPAGWTDKGGDGGNNNAVRVGQKVAGSSNEVSGTWTNCTNLICFVYRGATTVGAVAFANGTGAPITIPAINLLQKTDGSSWIAAVAADRTGGITLGSAAGLTPRAGSLGSSTQQDEQGYDSNGPVSAFPGSSVAATGLSSGWEGVAIEIRT